MVSNTSPITNLAAVGQLDLLRRLYGLILISDAVYQELVNTSLGVAGAREVQTLDWIQTCSVVDFEFVASLEEELDPGEAAAIALAVQLSANLLLIDERRGYQAATQLNLKVQGILGILIVAKAQGHILLVKPILDALVNDAGFWVTQRLYDRILQTAGE